MRLIAWFVFTSLAAAVLLGSCVTPQSERQNALVLPSEVVSRQAESNGYAGPQACAQCHSKNYSDYRASAHPKKLRPAAEARAFLTRCSTATPRQPKSTSHTAAAPRVSREGRPEGRR